MRIVIEVSRSANAQVVSTTLMTPNVFADFFRYHYAGVGQWTAPRADLKGMLYHYLEHRKEVVIRRTKFDLDKAEKRANFRRLRIALDNLDKVIKTIRASKSTDDGQTALIANFELSALFNPGHFGNAIAPID